MSRVALVVPDASVLLKWVLPAAREPQVEQAIALLNAFRDGVVDVLLPSLWIFEVGNVLARNYPDSAKERLAALAALALPEMPLDAAGRELALDMAMRNRTSFYDASYHAIALLHDGRFVTADRRYAEAAGAQGGLVLLSDWKSP